jgi:nucleoside-diphosphate-sugar epimerase
MNILITGGAGFLGTLVARRLLQRGTLHGESRAFKKEPIVIEGQ